MKTVFIIASLVALSLATTVTPNSNVETKQVEADFVAKQKKILTFFKDVGQVNPEAEYYRIGKNYDVETNIDNYTNKKTVEEFLALQRTGFMPKFKVFSVFYRRMREEAIALFHLFYYAKDFDIFYKTASYARVHFNEYQVIYAFYVAVVHRHDTRGIVLPAPYEVFPQYFTNMETVHKTNAVKMQGFIDDNVTNSYEIMKEDDAYVFYSKYSEYWTYGKKEQSLSYFTEDVGLNAYYFYFHSLLPFWMNGDQFGILKERRGEVYFYFYQQLLARYYLERLTNGLGEIPDFSWYTPIKTGFTPLLSTRSFPFVPRNEYYSLNNENNFEDIQFLDTYEKTFLQFLQSGHFKAYNQEVDLHNPKSINFVGNYWQANADLYEKSGAKNYDRSYEIIARRLLSASPDSIDKYTIAPSALGFYTTSLRDPVFYQLYSKILKYVLQYKENLEPYTHNNLHYVGVKINDVKVDELVTYFDFFDYDGSNLVLDTAEELKNETPVFKIRQPRLNNKPFKVDIEVNSEIEGEAVFKIFMGPKYNKGFPISLEENWMNFVELDRFVHKLTPGQNKVERSSNDFFFYKEDSIPTTEVLKMVEQGKIPIDMSENFSHFPKRLMLPKGLDGGSPFQLFVFVYPYQAPGKEYEPFDFFIDSKPLGYPFNRPVSEASFKQPNMFFKDVYIYHEGSYPSDTVEFGPPMYQRFIDFPDDEGNLHPVDLEAPIDTVLLNKIKRNPADNIYQLYTRRNPTKPQTLVMNKEDTITSSNFDRNSQTIVISHGWLCNQHSKLNPFIRDAILKKGEANVIILDWSRLSRSKYTTAVKGVPYIGQGLGQFLTLLNRVTGAPFSSMHLVGHSLGAHIVGNAGRELRGQVARVTGLDPAGPLWYLNLQALRARDGVYVEAIHTNRNTYGINLNVGDVDFYVNGGQTQPGCLNNNVCNHNRAWKLFAATVALNHLAGNKCLNLWEISKNRCHGKQLKMGNDDLKKRGRGMYRANTGKVYPY